MSYLYRQPDYGGEYKNDRLSNEGDRSMNLTQILGKMPSPETPGMSITDRPDIGFR